MDFHSHNQKETAKIASDLLKTLSAGDVVALHGELGSGKTTFAQAIGKLLGITDPITSPTFVFLKSYDIKENLSGISKLVHVDCYRMQNANDAEAIGLTEFLTDSQSLLLIEWPERITEILPQKTKHIYFQYLDETNRLITA